MRASGTIALQLREPTENFVIPAAQGVITPEQPQCKDARIICQLLPGGCQQVPLYPFSFLLLFCRGEDCCWWQYLSQWLNSLGSLLWCSGTWHDRSCFSLCASTPHLKDTRYALPSEWRSHPRAESSYTNKTAISFCLWEKGYLCFPHLSIQP